MPHIRKTRDEHVIQGNYGQGWEDLTAEETLSEARKRLREYRDNEPQYTHRRIKRRVPIVPPSNPFRYMIARNGTSDVWEITIRDNETAETAERRMKAIRGVLWKWDGITQLSISDKPSTTATVLD